jgi:hypothetical protein
VGRKLTAIKNQLLLDCAEGIKNYRPWEAGSFVCPVCLEATPSSRKQDISVAHILPDASAGKPITLLCRKCNSFFGSNQDRWFGDYRRMRDDGGTIFDLPTAAKVTGLNSTAAAGWIKRRKKNGPIEVHIYDRSVPENFDWASVRKISITHPFYDKEHQDNVGALTAAFLAYFSVFGYSWAMSWAAEPVRKQIRSPTKELLRGFCVCAPSHHGNTLGIAQIGDVLCPYAAFDDRFVLLPPVDWEDFYEKMHSALSSPSATLKWRVFEPLPWELKTRVSCIVVEGKLLLGQSGAPQPGHLCVYAPSIEMPVQVRRIIKTPISQTSDTSYETISLR